MPFIFSEVNSFDPESIKESSLTAAPLGIYQLPNVFTENGQRILPTAMPGSLVTQVASGITTLEAIEMAKGPDFINAIRIKVAGIQEYNDKSRREIYEVGQWIQKLGSCAVQIVAGSGVNRQTLNVEGIGNVTVPWVQIGTVGRLTRDFDRTTFSNIILFTAFALIWLDSRLRAENALLQEESEILAHIGWTEKQIKSHELKSQQYFLIGLNGLTQVGLFFLKVPWPIYLLSLGFLVVSLAIPYLHQSKFSFSLKFKTFKADKAVTHYWKFYQPIIILMWISYEVISLLTTSQYRSGLYFGTSSLGTEAISPVNQLMLILLVLAYVMTVVAIFESMSVILRERRDEFHLYQLVGWRQRDIYLHLVRESLNWMLKPFVSAMLVGITFAFLLGFIFAGWLVIVIISFSVLMVLNYFRKKEMALNWEFIFVTSAVTLLLGMYYSPELVPSTLVVNLLTLLGTCGLIFATIYFSLRKFYRAA
jgi:putative ABC transport system permease protein